MNNVQLSSRRIVLTTNLLLIFGVALFPGCIQMFAIRSVGGIMDYGFEAFNEESDLQLAQEALGSNLKLLEALIKADPDNKKFLMLTSQGYSAYALAFAEDDSAQRAAALYLRGRDYGLRILKCNEKFRNALEKDLPTFTAAVQSLSPDNVPALFWTAFGWGGYINLSKNDPSALAALAKVDVMMEFVLQHDPAFYYGSAHLYFGSVIGSTPQALGGKPEIARDHFERALALNGGKFLMSYVYYAKTYAVQVQDQNLFEEILNKVKDTSLDVLPDARFPNAVAKKKAKLLLEKVSELF